MGTDRDADTVADIFDSEVICCNLCSVNACCLGVPKQTSCKWLPARNGFLFLGLHGCRHDILMYSYSNPNMNAAKLFKKKIGSQWFLVLVLWNLPPSIRTKAEFLIPWGILPQGVESSDFPLYYQPFQGKHALLFVVHMQQTSVASCPRKESWCSMATNKRLIACGVSMSLLWRITQRAANVRTRATTGKGGSYIHRVRVDGNIRALRCFKCHIEKVFCRSGKTGYFLGAGSLLQTGHPLRIALLEGMYLGIYIRVNYLFSCWSTPPSPGPTEDQASRDRCWPSKQTIP